MRKLILLTMGILGVALVANGQTQPVGVSVSKGTKQNRAANSETVTHKIELQNRAMAPFDNLTVRWTFLVKTRSFVGAQYSLRMVQDEKLMKLGVGQRVTIDTTPLDLNMRFDQLYGYLVEVQQGTQVIAVEFSPQDAKSRVNELQRKSPQKSPAPKPPVVPAPQQPAQLPALKFSPPPASPAPSNQSSPTVKTKPSSSVTVANSATPPPVMAKTPDISKPVIATASFDTAKAKAHQAACAQSWGLPVEKEIVLPGGEKLTLVLIPPGEFLMGSTLEEQAKFRAIHEDAGKGMERELPQHRVRITKPFYLGKYEVTQAQWQSVMGNKPSPQTIDNPSAAVGNICWNDTQAFLAKLNSGAVGGIATLPTEAQWEYACRAGTTTAFFCGDDKETVLQSGKFRENRGTVPAAVGQFRPNPFGLYDMSGSLIEICADWMDAGYYNQSPPDDPTGPATGTVRVLRGGTNNGCWWMGRSAFRGFRKPGARDIFIGFRVALYPTLPTVVAPPPR